MKKITYKQYYDKVLGGWYGKIIGGTIGSPLEGDKRVDRYPAVRIPESATPNDDNDFQVVWLHALQEKGIYLESEDLMEEWLEHIDYPWNEYGYAVKNFRRGIRPPVSGWFNNNFFKECMGCPVRSEIWGYISPGNPSLAADYARKDAVLDHAGESVWSEVYLSVLAAEAFFQDNILKLIQNGLGYIPEDSRLNRCIMDVVNWHQQHDDWHLTRRFILDRYSHPDITSVVQNLGFTVMALLYGELNFDNTVSIAANSGYDADCTCASAGAIVGQLIGGRNFPVKWKECLNDNFKIGSGIKKLFQEAKITSFSEEVCKIGVMVTKEMNKDVTILDLHGGSKQLPTKDKGQLKLAIDYCGLPGIIYGEKKKVAILVRNETGSLFSGRLELEVPEGWRIEPTFYPLKIQDGILQRCEFEIVVPHTVKEMRMSNEIKASVLNGSDVIPCQTFGLSGPSIWEIFGPFWSGIDPFTNKADIDCEYLPEPEIENYNSDSKRNVIFEKVILQFLEDKLDLNNVFSLTGPAALYLQQNLRVLTNRKAWLLVGSNDALKIWLNDELVVSNREPRFMYPVNQAVEVNLNKGLNKILVKICRSGDSFQFCLGIRESREDSKGFEKQLRDKGDVWPYAWHHEHWMIDIASVPPWQVQDELANLARQERSKS